MCCGGRYVLGMTLTAVRELSTLRKALYAVAIVFAVALTAVEPMQMLNLLLTLIGMAVVWAVLFVGFVGILSIRLIYERIIGRI